MRVAACAILLCALSAAAAEGPCVGSGRPVMRDGWIVISQPTTRVQWREQAGAYAGAVVEYRGQTATQALSASGAVLRQYGINLRSANQCNAIYVMRPVAGGSLLVAVKSNPGMSTHQQCGARGYSIIKAQESAEIHPLSIGDREWLEASIDAHDIMRVQLDGALVWEGVVPRMQGSAGFRADNAALSLRWLAGPKGSKARQYTCSAVLSE